jgi:lysyl-tRNA synthetase class II
MKAESARTFILHPSSFILHPLQSRLFMIGPRIKDLPQHIGESVTVNGWLYNKRTAGKLQFPIIRDGSGYLQCVVSKGRMKDEG